MALKPVQIRIREGVNFTAVKDDRFKTGRISVSIFLPLDKQTVSQNAVLPFLLVRSCRKYPDFTKLNERFADLYGAHFGADVEKIGEAHVMSISATFLDDRYALDTELISNQVAELLCDMILDPCLQNESFFLDAVEQEKRQLIELIETQYNDKKTFAKQRCLSVMCADERFGLNPLGEKEEIKKLDGKKLYVAWKEMIRRARFEIMMLGNSDYKKVLEIFTNAFYAVKDRVVRDCAMKFTQTAHQIKTVTEYDNIAQSKMVLGFRTGSTGVDDNVAVRRVLNALFGGTPQSKLFLNVREKLSLCYYCSSRFDRNKGILLVECGVEKDNIESAKNEILKQLKEIQNGNFSNNDVYSVEISLRNSFKTIADHLGGLESFYLAQTYSREIKTPEEESEAVLRMFKEDVIEAANSLTLDTVYILTNRD